MYWIFFLCQRTVIILNILRAFEPDAFCFQFQINAMTHGANEPKHWLSFQMFVLHVLGGETRVWSKILNVTSYGPWSEVGNSFESLVIVPFFHPWALFTICGNKTDDLYSLHNVWADIKSWCWLEIIFVLFYYFLHVDWNGNEL